mgnify:CR=1 FL=1
MKTCFLVLLFTSRLFAATVSPTDGQNANYMYVRWDIPQFTPTLNATSDSFDARTWSDFGVQVIWTLHTDSSTIAVESSEDGTNFDPVLNPFSTAGFAYQVITTGPNGHLTIPVKATTKMLRLRASAADAGTLARINAKVSGQRGGGYQGK